jgi:hypothetical protein
LGIVKKWWHFFDNENFFSFLCEFYEKSGMCNNIFQFYFSFLAGHINLILCLIMTSLQK